MCSSTRTSPETEIRDVPTGGDVVGKLTGAAVSVSISHLPADPSVATLQVQTSVGRGVNIKGWVPANIFRFYASKDLPLVDHHVWITKTTELRLVGASVDSLTVEHTVLGSNGQSVRGTYGCDALSLNPTSPEQPDVPMHAKSYQMRSDSIELFNAPSGDTVFTLHMDPESRLRFWSTSTEGGFVRVEAKGDIVIDAYARRSSLTPLDRRREVFTDTVPTPIPPSPKKLALSETPPEVTIVKETPIHAQAGPSHPIGKLEVGARIYPMEVSKGWTNVLPVDLSVLPADGAGFWVKTADLP